MRLSSTLAVAGILAGLVTASPAVAASTPASFDVTSASLQAGTHADTTVRFHLASDDTLNPPFLEPDAQLKGTVIDLPPGLVGNPAAYDTCDDAQLGAADPVEIVSGGCDPATQVGLVHLHIQAFDLGDDGNTPKPESDTVLALYNMRRGPGQPGRLAFSFQGFVTGMIQLGVRSDSDYGVTATVSNLESSSAEILGADVTLWADPADPSHDQVRGSCLSLLNAAPTGQSCPFPAGRRHGTFMRNPSRCDAGLSAGFAGTFYDTAVPLVLRSVAQTFTGCSVLAFRPAIAVTPSSREAGRPTGLTVRVSVPQTDDAATPATPDLRDAVVTLPAGMALSAPVAGGLDACSDAQLAPGSRAAETCPEASRIGSVSIVTPLLDAPLMGSLYVGTQQSDDPESGRMYRLFVTAAGSGTRIKLRGAVRADRATGQLTATFADNPQLPFSSLTLSFKDGPRAPLVNPTNCGNYTATGSLSSWAGQTAAVSSAFAIDQRCPTGRFAPSFSAGTTSPLAGAFTPLTMSVARTDDDQPLSRITLDLPPGLLGALAGIPRCPEAQATAGTCGTASRVGSTRVAVGSGDAPFSLPGTVSLGGPYQGAPFSLSVAVPAKAGPFDLGLVVVRAALFVDRSDARVRAVTDPLPTIVGGVPIAVRSIDVALDRPGFVLNPTNCAQKQITAKLESAGGAAAGGTMPFGTSGCRALPYAPRLALTLGGLGQTTDGRHPALAATLTQPAGQANSRQAKVTLPLALALDPHNANGLCEPSDAAADRCPAASIVGRVSVVTPILAAPLSGPVYFVRGERIDATGRVRKTLPKLFVPLTGPDRVRIDLHASSDVTATEQRLVTTFTGLPDAPVTSFQLYLAGGRHGILVVSGKNLCTADQVAQARLDGQNGAASAQRITLGTPCALGVSKVSPTSSTLRVTVAGLAPGRLSVSAPGLSTRTRTIGTARVATLALPLTGAVRRTLSRGHDVKLRIRVALTAVGTGKARVATRTITLRGRTAR